MEAQAVNVAAAQSILEAVEASGMKTRVVLVGSAAEYGMVSKLDNPINEEHVLRPISVYGLTKAWQTELFYYYASRGSNVVLARIFNLLGTNLSERLFIGQLYKQIDEMRRGNRSSIELGSLAAIRDYIPIEQAAELLIHISKHGESGHVYHVASGRPISMSDLLSQELDRNGISRQSVVGKRDLECFPGLGVPCIYANIGKIISLTRQKGINVKI